MKDKQESGPIHADKSYPLPVRLRDAAVTRCAAGGTMRELLREAADKIEELKKRVDDIPVIAKEGVDQTAGYGIVASDPIAYNIGRVIAETDKWVKRGWIPTGNLFCYDSTWYQAIYRIEPGQGSDRADKTKPSTGEEKSKLPAIYEGMSTQGMLKEEA